MKSNFRIFVISNFIILILGLVACNNNKDIHYIKLDKNVAYFDNKKVSEYDYVWHINPKGDYDEIKDSPGEYHTGNKPNEEDGIWIAHDIAYFPIIDKNKFYKTNINGEPVWNTNFENEKYKDLVFGCLTSGYNGEFPYDMMHSEEEAYNNPCLHITLPGTYELSGKWNGQIFVDLGKDAEVDSSKKVNLLFNNLEVDCTVGPAINIYNAYECDNKWEDRKEPTNDIDLSNTGVNILLKDNTKNYLNGANVAKLYKAVFKKSGKEQKKSVKFDGTLITAVSMSINSEKLNNGELYVNSTHEGISSNLHLLLNGGKIYINSNDDGVNCEETNISIMKINNTLLRVNSGLRYQGDGLDSNGYIIIDGGDIVTVANYEQDPGVDSVNGIYINSGSLVALGETATADWPKIIMGENTKQSYIFKCFDDMIPADSRLVVRDKNGNEVYTFSEKDDQFIYSKKRPFIGALISNPKINGTDDLIVDYQ